MKQAEIEILNLISKHANKTRISAHKVLHHYNSDDAADEMRSQMSSMNLIEDLIEILKKPETKDCNGN